jgi:predicted amidohydrolase
MGQSVVVDPEGVIVAEAGQRECVLPATVNVEAVISWRQRFPALKDAGGLFSERQN